LDRPRRSLPMDLSFLWLACAARLARSGASPGRSPAVAQLTDVLPTLAPAGRWRALFDGHVKFLWNSRGDHQLFDLERDPGEMTNLRKRDGERARRMAAGIEGYLASLPKPVPEAASAHAPDAETQRALRSLGYVG
jgi:hypothetical protein